MRGCFLRRRRRGLGSAQWIVRGSGGEFDHQRRSLPRNFGAGSAAGRVVDPGPGPGVRGQPGMSVAKEVFADEGAAARACAARMAGILETRLGETGRVAIAVSGGTTPKPCSRRCGRAASIGRACIGSGWTSGAVAADDPGSNYGMTRAAILDPAKIPEANIHRIQGERGPQLAAERYADELREFFRLGRRTISGVRHSAFGDGRGGPHGESVSR